ncbi:MAG: hypothetical protein HRU16_03065 [Planctomycetes bacterium]|nr:hypothetical protein [Planctomycetota bacterium]
MEKFTRQNIAPAMDAYVKSTLFEQVIFRLRKSALWLIAVCAIVCASGMINKVEGQDAPVRGEPTLQPWVGKVKGSLVNIRTGPSLNHYSFLRLRDGSSLISVGGQGDWIEVAVPSDRPVWIHNDYLVTEGDFFKVTGSRVRLRATAGTSHAPLGLSEPGQVLVPTGKVSGGGSWVEVLAPLNAHAWIHGDYIRRTDQEVNPLHLARLHQSLKGQGGSSSHPVSAGSADSTDNPAANDPVTGSGVGAGDSPGEVLEPNTVRIPAFDSPKLKSLFDSFRAETQKNPVDWNFSDILKEVKNIETTSEDVGEIEIVHDLSKTIQEHFMPLHRRLVEIQRQQEEARAKRELVRVKEDEILRRTGHRSNPDVKFQAVGWVVPLGKHRDVEATHKLLKGNKLLYYLDGGKIELDQYVNKRVGIVGTIEEQKPSTGARLIRIQKIEILSR